MFWGEWVCEGVPKMSKFKCNVRIWVLAEEVKPLGDSGHVFQQVRRRQVREDLDNQLIWKIVKSDLDLEVLAAWIFRPRFFEILFAFWRPRSLLVGVWTSVSVDGLRQRHRRESQSWRRSDVTSDNHWKKLNRSKGQIELLHTYIALHPCPSCDLNAINWLRNGKAESFENVNLAPPIFFVTSRTGVQCL